MRITWEILKMIGKATEQAIGFRRIRSAPRIIFPDKFSSCAKTIDSQKNTNYGSFSIKVTPKHTQKLVTLLFLT